MYTRILLVVLAALLALPMAETASPVAAKSRSRTITRTFSNTALINLPISDLEAVAADLHPSPITVSGLIRNPLDQWCKGKRVRRVSPSPGSTGRVPSGWRAGG